eukprot:COSAG05_NODE_1064_length_5991_cov_12.180414_7_plen_158_part_00
MLLDAGRGAGVGGRRRVPLRLKIAWLLLPRRAIVLYGRVRVVVTARPGLLLLPCKDTQNGRSQVACTVRVCFCRGFPCLARGGFGFDAEHAPELLEEPAFLGLSGRRLRVIAVASRALAVLGAAKELGRRPLSCSVNISKSQHFRCHAMRAGAKGWY